MPPPPRVAQTHAATRLTYDATSATWRTSTVTVQLAQRPFARGGMRLAVRCDEVLRDGTVVPGVAKFFADANTPTKAHFAEASTQMIAENIAQEFNRAVQASADVWRTATRQPRGKPPTIGFVPVSVLRFDGGPVGPPPGHRFCTLEPLLEGEYKKHTDNDGMHDGHPVAVAFEHFSHQHTAGALVVCDIQGVSGTLYTDPQIHSKDGRGFGLGNLGSAGIDRWRATHKCNSLCHAACSRPSAQGSSRPSRSSDALPVPPQRAAPRPAPALKSQVAADHALAARLQAEEYGDASLHPEVLHGWVRGQSPPK